MAAVDQLRGPTNDLSVLLPIGMPLGLQHPDRGPATVFRVRLDRKVFVLDDDRLGAWFLAHSMRHNRESLATTMRSDGVADPITAIGSLISGRLLFPTAVSAEGALLLTAAHRLVPLMTGLAAGSGGYVVGVPGVVEHTVDEIFYQVFSRATSAPSILHALASAMAERSGPGPALHDLAVQFLGQLVEPLERGVVALDRAAGT